MRMIAARYIGTTAIRVRDRHPLDAEGKPLPTNVIDPGMVIQMPDAEVLGNTYKQDSPGGPIRHLGPGRTFLEGHEDFTDDELAARGYSFDLGRPDFEVVKEEAPEASSVPEEQSGEAAPSVESTPSL